MHMAMQTVQKIQLQRDHNYYSINISVYSRSIYCRNFSHTSEIWYSLYTFSLVRRAFIARCVLC